RGHDGLAQADQDAQSQIVAFGALELFRIAEALGVAQRHALEQHGVGRVGAGAARLGDEVSEESVSVNRLRHGEILAASREWSMEVYGPAGAARPPASRMRVTDERC